MNHSCYHFRTELENPNHTEQKGEIEMRYTTLKLNSREDLSAIHSTTASSILRTHKCNPKNQNQNQKEQREAITNDATVIFRAPCSTTTKFATSKRPRQFQFRRINPNKSLRSTYTTSPHLSQAIHDSTEELRPTTPITQQQTTFTQNPDQNPKSWRARACGELGFRDNSVPGEAI